MPAKDTGDAKARGRSAGAKRRAKGRRGRGAEDASQSPVLPEAEPAEPYKGPRPDEELLSAVHAEVIAGQPEALQRIYEMINLGEDVNQRHVAGFTPLALATAAGNVPMMSLLLEKHADVTIASLHRSELPLHHAANVGSHVAVHLLAVPSKKAGVINAPNNSGWTAAHLLAMNGHHEALRALLRCGASAESRNQGHGDDRPLHVATRSNRPEAVEVLLDHDADVNAADSLGRHSLHIAAAHANLDLVGLLLRSRADPHRTGHGGGKLVDLVPKEHRDGTKVVDLLSAYSRVSPPAIRVDTRFDVPDGLDLI